MENLIAYLASSLVSFLALDSYIKHVERTEGFPAAYPRDPFRFAISIALLPWVIVRDTWEVIADLAKERRMASYRNR